MQGSQYIFCLQDKNFKFWSINAAGAVTLSGVPYFLDFAPDGWNEIAIQNVVNKTYKGIDRSVTIPLGYVQDGAKILKHIFYTYGLGTEVFLSISSQQINYIPNVSYGFWYKQIYRGLVDWTTYTHAGTKITCTTLEDGFPKHLKANDKTVYEIPINVPDAVYVKLDGINLRQKLNYVYVDGLGIQVGGQSNGVILPIVFTIQEGDSTGVLHQSETYAIVPINSNVFAAAQNNFVLYNAGTVPISFTVQGAFQIKCTQKTASQCSVTFRMGVGNNGVSTQNIALSNQVFLNLNQVFSYTVNTTVTIPAGQYLFFFATSTLIGTSAAYEFQAGSKLDIKFTSRYQATYVRALRAQYVFSYLIKKLTNSEFKAAPSQFLLDNYTKVLTCGNAIRGLDDAVLKISFEMFFKFFDCVYSAAINTVGNVVDIGQEEVIADLINTIDLPAPAHKTFKVTVAKDLLINQIKIGYPEIKNEVGVLNGNEEFNDAMLFSTEGTISTGVLDKISPIKTSSYEVEKIRITTFEKNTTDFKSDNDLFALHIESTVMPAIAPAPAHYKLDRLLNTLVTEGLIESTSVFNLWFSPKRNFLRSGSNIRGRFYKSDTQVFFYRSADKNSKVLCDGVDEDANVSVGSLTPAIAIPINFDFDAPVFQSPISLLELNPLRAFRFLFNGNYYVGLLNKISIESATNKTQNIQLRSAASNDLTELIKYTG